MSLPLTVKDAITILQKQHPNAVLVKTRTFQDDLHVVRGPGGKVMEERVVSFITSIEPTLNGEVVIS